uniref:Uncharacterized protein n=1 Tax=Arundo donax TaxID=35708 RepID=A0A0A9F306_ARUDO
MQTNGWYFCYCVGEERTSAAYRSSKKVLHRAWNSGLSWKQGMHISKHDTAPDKLLFHLQPFSFRAERRR